MSVRSILRTSLAFFLFTLVCRAASPAEPINPLAQHPALTRDTIVFRFADDLWSVSRSGGEAQRLTATGAVRGGPYASPDGRWLAYSADFDGNVDVYAIPAEGGRPRRLTYRPDADDVVGWTPDSSAVLFSSSRNSRRDIEQLFTVGLEGQGLPQALPLPSAADGALSADGTHIAYIPFFQSQQAWKRYRGGQTTPIWIADLKTLAIEKVPRDNSNDSNPFWVDGKLYFLSDRNGPVALFAYDPGSRKAEPVVENHGKDFKSAAGGQGAIVYEQFGDIHLYDLQSHTEHGVRIRIRNDLPELRPHLIHPDPKQIQNFAISPSGERLVAEVRGDIFTIPREKGDVRNLTNSPSAADRDPAWSPDGKRIAYFSDRSGEYALYLQNQSGLGELQKIDLGNPPCFFYSPVWSPDSKHIAYTDTRLNLWVVSAEGGAPVKVDTDYSALETNLEPSWSGDSQWIVYAKDLPSHLHALYVYSMSSGKSTQITDGMSDAQHAAFDRNGKYLYFTASTNVGPAADQFDLSAADRPVSASVYVMVLAKDLPSPLKPESDEEKVTEAGAEKKSADEDKDKKDEGKEEDNEKKDDKEKKDESSTPPPKVTIDFEGIAQRILALPMPQRNYESLETGKTGIVYVGEGPVEAVPVSESQSDGIILHRLDLDKRKEAEVLHGITNFAVSEDGSRIAYSVHGEYSIADDDEMKPDSGRPGKHLNLAEMQTLTDPQAEWRQIYHETWRIERDFFYDPHYHGLDLKRAEAEYAPYLERLGCRDGLSDLFMEMLGNLTVGHMFISGPRPAPPAIPPPGLLGADYETAEGRYRFARVFDGENWNPELRAPLTGPGVNVHAGEYLLAVNGRELHSSDNVYSFFEGTSGKQTVLRVGSKADGSDSRDVTVVPVASETGLRTLAWVEDNRRKVDSLTGGRVAYVYLPDTADGGYNYFNRYFYAQVGKEAAIIDERFNHGGDLADYVIDALRRPMTAYVVPRNGAITEEPGGAIFGPRVMLINQMAGSGGDALPWLFRKEDEGKLIGVRTWGGLVGIGGYPQLLDGGSVTAPRMAVYGLEDKSEVENIGIAPDIEIQMLPAKSRDGHDPQLEEAIHEVMEELAAHPLPKIPKPVFPDYHQQEKQ